jgi:hypothetical protein
MLRHEAHVALRGAPTKSFPRQGITLIINPVKRELRQKKPEEAKIVPSLGRCVGCNPFARVRIIIRDTLWIYHFDVLYNKFVNDFLTM